MIIPLGRILGIPTYANGSALLVLAFLVFGQGARGAEELVGALLYGAVVFGSILVHELGHAVVGRRLGLNPRRILLHGFGGLCEYGRAPKAREGLISAAAGPVAGLILGALALALSLTVGASLPPRMAWLLGAAVQINIFWSLFNLLPMYPLDGGSVLWNALRLRRPGNSAWLLTRKISIGTAILVAIAGLVTGHFFVIIVAGMVLAQTGTQR